MDWSTYWLMLLQIAIAFVIFFLPLCALIYFLVSAGTAAFFNISFVQIERVTTALRAALEARRDKTQR